MSREENIIGYVSIDSFDFDIRGEVYCVGGEE